MPFFILLLCILDEVECSHEINEAEAQNHGDNTHDDSHLRHILLLNKASGKGQGIRRRRDGQDHG